MSHLNVQTGKHKIALASRGDSGLSTGGLQTCVALVGKEQKTGAAFIWHLNCFCTVGKLNDLLKDLEEQKCELSGFKVYCRYGWGPGQIMHCLLLCIIFAAVFLHYFDDEIMWFSDNSIYKFLVVGVLLAGFIAFQARAALWGGLLWMKFVHGKTFAGYPESLGHTAKLLRFGPTGVRISTHPNQEPVIF